MDDNSNSYAIEVNKTLYDIGPWVERYIIRFNETGAPSIVANFSHIGSQTTENIAISNSSQIYILGYKLIGNDMCLWNITASGTKTLISDKLPIDPLAVAVDSEENLYVTCSVGLIKIFKTVEDTDGIGGIIYGFNLNILILSLIAITISTTLFQLFTVKLDEMDHIRENNIAVAVVLGSVVIASSIIIQPGLSFIINTLIPTSFC